MEKLAHYVDKEEKIGVKFIVSAQVLERLSQVASTGEPTVLRVESLPTIEYSYAGM